MASSLPDSIIYAFYAGGALLAYLIGSIPFAVVVSRLMGLQDPRSYGSKNPGATNVLRSGSKVAAALTLLGDAAKGWFALWLIRYMLPIDPFGVAVVALAVFLGHLYPVFLKFKGGKGVATALGVLLAIQPWLALMVALTWLIMAAVFRYSSLAALIAAVCAPLYYYLLSGKHVLLLGGRIGWEAEPLITAALAIISAFLIYRHKANIQRLLSGTESKIGSKKLTGNHATESKPGGYSSSMLWLRAVYILFGAIPAFFLIAVLLALAYIYYSSSVDGQNALFTTGWLLLNLCGCIGLIMAPAVRPGIAGRKAVLITTGFLAAGFIDGAWIISEQINTIASVFRRGFYDFNIVPLLVLICMVVAVLYFFEAGFAWMRSAARTKHRD